MKTTFTSIFLSLISLSTVSASPVTPAEALGRLNSSSQKSPSTAIKGNPALIRTIHAENRPAIYLFDTGGRILFLSADDAVTPILGYTDSSFSSEIPAVQSWLETLSREISSIGKGERAMTRSTILDDNLESIEPLCKTRWNQAEPFNNDCPEMPYDAGRTVTGCVATSMAQVMKYHRWPERPVGAIEYEWQNNENQILSLDFSSQTFFWGNMLDQYIYEGYSFAQADAVASLMKCCGYSVEMNYGLSMSGAMSASIAYALGTFFRYDKSKIDFIQRDYCSLEEWERAIYRSLREDGPVILNGQSKAGGHSFVCDGYDRDGYFHINWGWGGLSDGYYLLSALDPFNQGIGGSEDNSGFNFMQDAIVGITPDYLNRGGEWFGQLYAQSGFDIDWETSYAPGEIVGPFCNSGVFNYGPGIIPEDTYIGLLFRSLDSDGFYIEGEELGGVVNLLYGFKEVELPMPLDLPDGRYFMTFSYTIPSYSGRKPAKVAPDTPNEAEDEGMSHDFSPDTFWIDVKFPYGECQGYYAMVKDGSIVLTPTLSNPSGAETPAISSGEAIRWFNLQGIEMKAPRKGEPAIRVDGEARKVMPGL